MRTLSLAAALAALTVSALAVDTSTWQHTTQADFEKGMITRLSLSSSGKLSVAPALKDVYDPSVPFLWAIARDSKGNVYVGGGGLGGAKAKLFVIPAGGQGKLLAELEGISVQAIAIDSSDRVYAATSPDGKVYRVDSNGTSSVFYDPHTKYIWALTFGKNGDLFVATGDQGEIHRVTPQGTPSVFFRTEETHARSLAVDAAGNLIAGTEPSGLILRITPNGEGFVLHQAAKREVTTLAAASDGTIYAAAVGNKQNVPVLPSTPPQIVNPGVVTLPNTPQAPPAVVGGSEVYKILPDGYARRVWSHAQDIVYALALDAQGKPVVATGNHGNIYRLDSDFDSTMLLNVAPTQATGLLTESGGRLLAITGNIGKVLAVGPELEASGTYESDILDATAFSYWGRITQKPEPGQKPGSGVTFETRSGNLNRAQRNWSLWTRLSADRIASPSARYLQYRATLTGPATLSEVNIAYEMKNVAPVVSAAESTPANYRFPAPAAPSASTAHANLTLPAIVHTPTTPAAPSPDNGTTPAMTWQKGQIGARWLASDENGDTLEYKVEIRGEREQTWKPLKDKVRERYISFDSTAFPDGRYIVRVTATDSPSNVPAEALTASRETDSFLIDNTPPEISGLAAAVNGSTIEVRFTARDALSWLGKAEYSVNGGDWLIVEPTTRLTDSPEHDYRWTIDRGTGEVTIAVRVSDEFENQATAKTVVR